MPDSVLTQEEIDNLLKKYNTEDASLFEKTESKPETEQKKEEPVLFDFRKPNKLKNENLGAIKQIHDEFTKLLSANLSYNLRATTQMEMDSNHISQTSYQEYINSMSSDNFLWGTFDLEPLKGARWFIQYELRFCYYYINKVFGGNISYDEVLVNSKMPDINKDFSKMLFNKSLLSYKDAWSKIKSLGDFNAKNLELEKDPRNLNLRISNTDTILIIPIQITITSRNKESEDVGGKSIMHVGIPFTVIEPILDSLSIQNLLSETTSKENNMSIKSKIKDIKIDVSASIVCGKILFKDILNIKPGDIISSDLKIGEPFDFEINKKVKAKCIPYTDKNQIVVKII